MEENPSEFASWALLTSKVPKQKVLEPEEGMNYVIRKGYKIVR
jgi:hypothetical protein